LLLLLLIQCKISLYLGPVRTVRCFVTPENHRRHRRTRRDWQQNRRTTVYVYFSCSRSSNKHSIEDYTQITFILIYITSNSIQKCNGTSIIKNKNGVKWKRSIRKVLKHSDFTLPTYWLTDWLCQLTEQVACVSRVIRNINTPEIVQENVQYSASRQQ